MIPREQEDLVQRILDGDASPEDIAAFQTFFREDANFRQRYYDHTALVDFMESTFRPKPAVRDFEPLNSPPARSKALSFPARWAAVAALILLLSVAGFLLWGLRGKSVVGELAFSDGSRWSLQGSRSGAQADATAELSFSPGDILELQQGVARISFKPGIQAVVSGPARFSYVEPGHFQLDHGMVWFDVPERATEKIVVTTPRMRLADRGTQFGVIASRQGIDEVHVQEGQVESEGLLGGRERAVVNAGRAVAFGDSGSVREQRVNSAGFVHTLPRSLPHVHWSFDEVVAGKFPAAGEYPHLDNFRAEYRSPAATPSFQRLVSGVFGNAVGFQQAGDLVVTPYAGVSGNAPRTVAFWLRLPPEQTEMHHKIGWTGLLGWGRRRYPDMTFTESIHAIIGPPKIQQKAEWSLVPILSFERVWLEGSTNLADGKWHHLVWIYSGKLRSDQTPDVACYCDGQPERLITGVNAPDLAHSPIKIDTVVDDEKSVPVILGGSLLSIDDKESLFPGEMDEVYVIEGAITPAAARRLFLENRFVPETPTNTSGK